MKRKVGGLILGMWALGAVLAPVAGASETCNGQELTFLCPPWQYGSVCVSHDGVSADLSNCGIVHRG